MTARDTAAPEISVLVPVVEEAGDLSAMYREVADALAAVGRPAEVVFVVDRRQHAVIPALEAIEPSGPEVVIVRLGGQFGESAALTVGLEQARGEVVVTFASYFQVDPGALVEALARLEAGADLVVGRRFPRTDPWFNRLQSRLFHLLLRTLTGSRFHDISCGFRVMRRRVARELNVYGGLHRFIPILAEQRGFAVEEMAIAQRPENRRLRYYGIALYLKRLIDVVTVFFLIKFTRRPLRFFGLIGLGVAAVGAAITAYLGAYRLLGIGPIGDRPLLLLGVLLIVLGFQTFSLGLLGEIVIFTHARQIREYQIAEVVRRPQGREPTRTRPSAFAPLPHRAS